MASIGRCGSYESRPTFCKVYPRITDFMPPGCTYHFVGEERRGECQPEVCGQNCCCAYPREGGEPEGKSLDHLAGGLPCKHLVWIEEPKEKKASLEEKVVSATQELTEAICKALEEDI